MDDKPVELYFRLDRNGPGNEWVVTMDNENGEELFRGCYTEARTFMAQNYPDCWITTPVMYGD